MLTHQDQDWTLGCCRISVVKDHTAKPTVNIATSRKTCIRSCASDGKVPSSRPGIRLRRRYAKSWGFIITPLSRRMRDLTLMLANSVGSSWEALAATSRSRRLPELIARSQAQRASPLCSNGSISRAVFWSERFPRRNAVRTRWPVVARIDSGMREGLLPRPSARVLRTCDRRLGQVGVASARGGSTGSGTHGSSARYSAASEGSGEMCDASSSTIAVATDSNRSRSSSGPTRRAVIPASLHCRSLRTSSPSSRLSPLISHLAKKKSWKLRWAKAKVCGRSAARRNSTRWPVLCV
jgi:hypothetical protein